MGFLRRPFGTSPGQEFRFRGLDVSLGQIGAITETRRYVRQHTALLTTSECATTGLLHLSSSAGLQGEVLMIQMVGGPCRLQW